jgi:hypothetical protein
VALFNLYVSISVLEGEDCAVRITDGAVRIGDTVHFRSSVTLIQDRHERLTNNELQNGSGSGSLL